MKSRLSSFILCLLLSVPSTAQIVINEIMWDEQEYIELRNTGGSARDISGWTIEVGGTVEVTIDGGASVSAGGFYLIVDNATTVTVTENEIDAMTLNQGGELVVLKDTQGVEIDTANQAGAWFAGIAGDEGVAMSRADTPGDGTIATNWSNDLGGIGGRYGSPGETNIFTVNSAAAKPGDVVINEIMWDELEYIELRNTASDTVKIGDWTITASGNLEATIDGGAEIEPGGFYLVGDAGAVSFGMADTDAINLNQTGETVELFHANGLAIDTANDGGAWFAGQSTGGGISMSRKTPPGDGYLSASWADDLGQIGGRNGSPGAQNRFTDGILFKSLPLEGENPVLVAGNTLRFEAQLFSGSDSSPIVGESVLFVFSDIFGNGLQQSMGVTDSNGAVSIDFDTTTFLQTNPLICTATAVFLTESSVQIEWPFRIAEPGNTGIFVDSEFYYRVEVLPPGANVRYETDLVLLLRADTVEYGLPVPPFATEQEFLDALQEYKAGEGYPGEGVYDLQRLLDSGETRAAEAVLSRVINDSAPAPWVVFDLINFARSQESEMEAYFQNVIIPTLSSIAYDAQVPLRKRAACASVLWFLGERDSLLAIIFESAESDYEYYFNLTYFSNDGFTNCDPAVVPFLRKVYLEIGAERPKANAKKELIEMGLEPLE